MGRCAPLMVAALLGASGCYLSHGGVGSEPEGGASDSGAPRGDACVFSFEDRPTDTIVECRIELGSSRGCMEAARCICTAREGIGSEEVERCVASETVPRAMITLSDFCNDRAPARMTMTEALEGYLRFADSVRISPECASVPALFGP